MADRNEHGQFVKGKSGNPNGRPKREQERSYLDILISIVTEARWKRIVVKAADMAENGDIQAMKFLAGYAIGEPEKTVNLRTNPKDYTEILEEELERFRNIESDNEGESQQGVEES